MTTTTDTVLRLWCRLTGETLTDPVLRAAFLRRPQVDELATSPYPELLDAAIASAERGSLPLDRWLANLRRQARASA